MLIRILSRARMHIPRSGTLEFAVYYTRAFYQDYFKYERWHIGTLNVMEFVWIA